MAGNFRARPKKKKSKNDPTPEEQEMMEIRRIKMPKNGQVFGILEQRLGASRNKVRCLDGRTRVCRIPGRLKRGLWVREGDLLLVEPWEHSGDEKGDIIFKYRPTQVAYLRKKGVLKTLDEFEEF
ncbi:translation initiation factor eIF-1A [Candidatus Woesearchaeota archaeon CG10_big_fil_rev_8_21_14_0_10_34_8]|nr:MAG: translation initiation factor eIF-1A [Candidatus Woesearchaeota archaeon CG10_big_fil_rev_8_21_14_0_10_34_8]